MKEILQSGILNFKGMNIINQKIKTMQIEIQSLQNMANSIGIDGLVIQEQFIQDKRKTTKKYILADAAKKCYGPVLDYNKMNHFLLGVKEARIIFGNNSPIN